MIKLSNEVNPDDKLPDISLKDMEVGHIYHDKTRNVLNMKIRKNNSCNVFAGLSFYLDTNDVFYSDGCTHIIDSEKAPKGTKFILFNED